MRPRSSSRRAGRDVESSLSRECRLRRPRPHGSTDGAPAARDGVPAAGIAREAAYDVFAGGVAASPYVLYERDAFLRPDETPVAFTVELMREDVRLVFALADDLGVPLAAVRAADEVLARACELRLSDADLSRVAQVIRDG